MHGKITLEFTYLYFSQAKKYLGWEPKVSLNEGLEKSIPYFREAVNLELSKSKKTDTVLDS